MHRCSLPRGTLRDHRAVTCDEAGSTAPWVHVHWLIWLTLTLIVARQTGNYGNVESGVRHLKGWGTGWGGYVLIEVDDPKALDHYQLFCNQNYGHVVHLTFEPLFDSDAALAETVSKLK